ncbi:hypothetical protein OPV22_031414 [Ensete ventricosum]|uniref:Uncharacterized protein n=1 Tax=Ensete ventricosum TaxID=4639 RepID=A0AAV8PP90_ENSVE|nr:hypothetical protein OPV22_031414 [Ensete ventricosum]
MARDTFNQEQFTYKLQLENPKNSVMDYNLFVCCGVVLPLRQLHSFAGLLIYSITGRTNFYMIETGARR